MWTILPSPSPTPSDEFFSWDDVTGLVKKLRSKPGIPVIRGRVWGGEERSQSWSVECEGWEEFETAVQGMAERIELVAFDEMELDDETLRVVQDDLHRISIDEGLTPDLASKAMSALRSHESELYAVVAYAFLDSGRVVFLRAQTELANFIYHPDRLLSNDGLAHVRKLKTLNEQQP
jgi:hypothetical protein